MSRTSRGISSSPPLPSMPSPSSPVPCRCPPAILPHLPLSDKPSTSGGVGRAVTATPVCRISVPSSAPVSGGDTPSSSMTPSSSSSSRTPSSCSASSWSPSSTTAPKRFQSIFFRERAFQRRLTRLVSVIILALLALFYYVGNLSEEDGKELMGQMASTAQIAGSFVCPWLIVGLLIPKE